MDEDIHVTDPTSGEAAAEGYAPSDVEHVMRLRDWQSWDELVTWLREEGDNDNELTPGEVEAMASDFERMSGKELPEDPQRVYEVARGV